MRPLSLKGHDRALTRVRFNREGDLLITAAKNKQPCLWYTENGERIEVALRNDGAQKDKFTPLYSLRMVDLRLIMEPWVQIPSVSAVLGMLFAKIIINLPDSHKRVMSGQRHLNEL
ncbi:hypothetical protein COOONC_21004 [Cooperia oncophora]